MQEPRNFVEFALTLSRAIGRAWGKFVAKDEANAIRAKARLWMYLCARDVLGSAMLLLTVRLRTGPSVEIECSVKVGTFLLLLLQKSS